jgi:transposase
MAQDRAVWQADLKELPMNTAEYVGIDVAKARLDVAVRPSGEQWVSATDPASLDELVGRLQKLQPELIVLEATGGREGAVVAALAAAGLPVAVVNPRQVRDFARAIGQLAKTDVLDAQVLAHFAQVIHPAPRPLPDAQAQELTALMARRRQLIGMQTAERQRLDTALPRVRRRLRATSPGWKRSCPTWTRPCTTRCRPAPSGGSGRICCAASPASAPPPP